MVEQAGSQIEGVKVAGGIFPSLMIAGIMSAGGMEVSVASLEMEFLKRGMQVGGGVFEQRFLRFALGESVVEIAEVFEAAGALEPLEVGRAFGCLVLRVEVEVLQKPTS